MQSPRPEWSRPTGAGSLGLAVLGAADVAGYLLERELLSPRAVVDGASRVEDVSRRNRVFVATTTASAGRSSSAGEPPAARAWRARRRCSSGSARSTPAARWTSPLPALVAHDPARLPLRRMRPVLRALRAGVLAAVPLSQHILRRPDAAAAQLLGLGVRPEAA